MFQANLFTVILTSLKLHFLKIEMFSVKKRTESNGLGMDPAWLPGGGSPGTILPGPFGSGPCEEGGEKSQDPQETGHTLSQELPG